MLDSLEALLWVKDVVEVYGIVVVFPVSSLLKMHTSELNSNRRDARSFYQVSRKMKRPLSFLNSNQKLLPQDIDVRIIRKLNVIRTSHYRDQKLVRCVWWLARLANHGEHWAKALESYLSRSVGLSQSRCKRVY